MRVRRIHHMVRTMPSVVADLLCRVRHMPMFMTPNVEVTGLAPAQETTK